METADFMQNLVTVKSLTWVFELLVAVFPVLYTVFAFIVIRQVKLMTKSFSSPISPMLLSFAYIHFIAALIIALLAVLSLLF